MFCNKSVNYISYFDNNINFIEYVRIILDDINFLPSVPASVCKLNCLLASKEDSLALSTALLYFLNKNVTRYGLWMRGFRSAQEMLEKDAIFPDCGAFHTAQHTRVVNNNGCFGRPSEYGVIRHSTHV